MTMTAIQMPKWDDITPEQWAEFKTFAERAGFEIVDCPDDVTPTSAHEAAHAVAYILLGLRFTEARIGQHNCVLSRPARSIRSWRKLRGCDAYTDNLKLRTEKDVMIGLAAPAYELLSNGFVSSGCVHDVTMAMQRLRRPFGHTDSDPVADELVFAEAVTLFRRIGARLSRRVTDVMLVGYQLSIFGTLRYQSVRCLMRENACGGAPDRARRGGGRWTGAPSL